MKQEILVLSKTDTQLKLTIPNVITFGRIIGAVILWFYWWSPWFYAVLALSDTLDGWLARKLDCKTKLGEDLDPIADKILNWPLLFGYFWLNGSIPTFFILIFAIREVAVGLIKLCAWNRGARAPALYSGKIKFILESVLIFCLFFERSLFLINSILIFLFATAVWSVVEYGKTYGFSLNGKIKIPFERI